MTKPPEPDEPRAHPWVWVVMTLLFAASVPWYLPTDRPVHLWFGLPYWVVISLAASGGIAIFTAWVVSRYWGDAEADEPGSEDRRR